MEISKIKSGGLNLLLYGAGAVALFFAFKFLLKYIKNQFSELTARGVTTSATEIEYKKYQQKVYTKYGKPTNFLEIQNLARKQFPNVNSFSTFAESVYDGKSILLLPDKEDKALGVFSALASKFEISYFAKFFYEKYQRGLMSYVNSYFSTEQLVYLNDIISKKPDIL